MRAGWNPDLEARLRRADPDARLIVEAVVVGDADVRQRQDQWQDADSTAGLETHEDGSVRLSPSGSRTTENATDDGTYLTTLNDPTSADRYVARVDWFDADGLEVRQVTCRLVAQRDGGQAKTVERWKLQLFRIARVNGDPSAVTRTLELAPISGIVEVEAVGTTTPSDVTFVFPGPSRPRPGLAGRPDGAEPGEFAQPVTYVQVWGVQADGSLATNVGWAVNGAATSATSPDNSTISQSHLTADIATQDYLETTFVQGVPRLSILSGTFTAQTIAFTGAGNQIDLGAAPTADVELVGQGDTFSDAGILYEVSADGVTWYEFVDGDVAGADNAARVGKDLTALPVQQTYQIRATLSPSSAGDVSPVLRALGAQVVTVRPLDALTRVEGGSWAIDPVALKGETTEVSIVVLIDGERDYRSAIEDIVAENDLGDIAFRIWVGADSLDRSRWMLLDALDIDDYEPVEGGIRFLCLSALARCRATLPPFNAATSERVPIEWGNDPLATIYADLLDGHIGLPSRYRGQGVTDTLTTASKTISEEVEAKGELDAVAYLAGGGVIASQGRVKFIPMHDLGGAAPVRAFASTDLKLTGARPGFRYRIAEWFAPYKWSNAEGRFQEEHRAFSSSGLLALGRARIDAPRRLDDVVARWVDDVTLAETLGRRVVTTTGTGLILWDMELQYPHPELEPGDRIVVQTDRFVAKDPDSGRALRGSLWALGVVQAVHDVWGRVLTLWVQGFRDIGVSTEPVDRQVPSPGRVPGSPTVLRRAMAVDRSSTSHALVDLELYVEDAAGQDVTLELWTAKSTTASADPTLAADGSVVVPSGDTVGAASQSPDVVEALLDDIRVPEGDAEGKRIYYRATAADGRSSGVREMLLVAMPRAIDGGGHINIDEPWAGLSETPAETIDNATAGAVADIDLTAMDVGGYLDRTAHRLLRIRDTGAGVDVDGGTARIGARLVDTGDALKLPATEAVRLSGATLEAVTSQITDSGHLAETAKQSDGVQLRTLVKGVQTFEAEDGDPVVFDPPFESVPVIRVLGGRTFVAAASGTDQYTKEPAVTALGTGGCTVAAKILSKSGTAGVTDNFPAGVLTVEGDALSLAGQTEGQNGGAGLSADASDDSYTARYFVDLSCTAGSGSESEIFLTVVVAVDVWDSSDAVPAWEEKGSKTYDISASNGATANLEKFDTISFSDAGIVAGDDIRVRIKSVTVFEFGASGSESVSVDPQRVTYQTATVVEYSRTPSAGDKVIVEAWGVFE